MYSPPAGTLATPNTVIASSPYNGFVDDLTQDANTARPVGAGGTGGTTADQAAVKLGLVSAKDLAGANTVGGTAAAITISTDRGYTALSSSTILAFKAKFASVDTGTTIALDSVTATALRKVVGTGDTDIDVGDLIPGALYTVKYDPTINVISGTAAGGFILTNPSSGTALVGDFLATARTLDNNWLRLNGGVYDASDYPALAALFPPLAAGVVWSALTPPFGSAAANGIAASSTRVAVVSGATVYYTDDLVTWTTVALPVSTQGDEAISYGGGRFLVVGSYLGSTATAFSTDGCQTWSTPVTALQVNLRGKFPYGAGVFTVGSLGGPGSPTAIISTSPTGGVWTTRIGPQGPTLKPLFADGTGIVVGSDDGYYYTSTDGATFAQKTPNIAAIPITSGVRRAGVSILTGSGGVINTTTDFTTMTSRVSGTTSSFLASAVIDPMIVAVGAAGVCRWSVDNGVNWDASATGVSIALQALIKSPFSATEVLSIGTGTLLKGQKTSSAQFQVPDLSSTYAWIKALG